MVANPQPDRRLVTADEIARFEFCPLAWWYDRTHPLAQAAPTEIEQRRLVLETVYGPGAKDLPEYQMLTHLKIRADQQPLPVAGNPSVPEYVVPHPRPLIALVFTGVFVVGLLLTIAILLAVRHP